MRKIRLTKNELRLQRDNLKRFRRYLPVLYLKKQLLQKERERALGQLRKEQALLEERGRELAVWMHLLTEKAEWEGWLELEQVEVRWDNVAGVDVPHFAGVRWRAVSYDLLREPLWLDRALPALRDLLTLVMKVTVRAEQERRLARELQVTAQRVNLFEQVKIPQAEHDIRKITIQLADQETAAFGWALIAKRKLERAA